MRRERERRDVVERIKKKKAGNCKTCINVENWKSKKRRNRNVFFSFLYMYSMFAGIFLCRADFYWGTVVHVDFFQTYIYIYAAYKDTTTTTTTMRCAIVYNGIWKLMDMPVSSHMSCSMHSSLTLSLYICILCVINGRKYSSACVLEMSLFLKFLPACNLYILWYTFCSGNHHIVHRKCLSFHHKYLKCSFLWTVLSNFFSSIIKATQFIYVKYIL